MRRMWEKSWKFSIFTCSAFPQPYLWINPFPELFTKWTFSISEFSQKGRLKVKLLYLGSAGTASGGREGGGRSGGPRENLPMNSDQKTQEAIIWIPQIYAQSWPPCPRENSTVFKMAENKLNPAVFLLCPSVSVVFRGSPSLPDLYFISPRKINGISKSILIDFFF